MKTTFRLIFICFIGLLLLVAVAAFFGRQTIRSWVNTRNDLGQMALEAAPEKPVNLDTALLKSTKFLSLKNNVTNFDFDSICKRPVAKTAVVETKGAAATGSPVSVGCVLGNNVPIRNK